MPASRKQGQQQQQLEGAQKQKAKNNKGKQLRGSKKNQKAARKTASTPKARQSSTDNEHDILLDNSLQTPSVSMILGTPGTRRSPRASTRACSTATASAMKTMLKKPNTSGLTKKNAKKPKLSTVSHHHDEELDELVKHSPEPQRIQKGLFDSRTEDHSQFSIHNRSRRQSTIASTKATLALNFMKGQIPKRPRSHKSKTIGSNSIADAHDDNLVDNLIQNSLAHSKRKPSTRKSKKKLENVVQKSMTGHSNLRKESKISKSRRGKENQLIESHKEGNPTKEHLESNSSTTQHNSPSIQQQSSEIPNEKKNKKNSQPCPSTQHNRSTLRSDALPSLSQSPASGTRSTASAQLHVIEAPNLKRNKAMLKEGRILILEASETAEGLINLFHTHVCLHVFQIAHSR